MLEEFNKTFEVEGPFKMVELENAIMEKYGSIQYFRYKGWKEVTDYNETIIHPECFECGTDFEWEDNRISTEGTNYKTREEALQGMLIEYKKKFEKLVKEVYETVL